MVDDEVPKSFASAIGHVCGVVAVGMTTLSLFGVWSLAHKPTVPLAVLVTIGIALAMLMFRWAGALTGLWDTRGRLAVPKLVYSILGAIFVAATILSLGLAIATPPASVDEGLTTIVGVSGGASMAYLCYLAYHRFK